MALNPIKISLKKTEEQKQKSMQGYNYLSSRMNRLEMQFIKFAKRLEELEKEKTQ